VESRIGDWVGGASIGQSQTSPQFEQIIENLAL
jgi:hypothetical protein